MPTPAERQALLFVAAVAALGLGVRACARLGIPDAAPVDRAALAKQLERVDSALATGGARRRAPIGGSGATGVGVGGTRRRPSSRRATVPSSSSDTGMPAIRAPLDIDVASAAELDRLPGIGPALAARIVADREARGPFGSLEALERVRGIGPALAARLRAHVTFSLAPRPPDAGVPAVGRSGGVRHP